MSGISEDTISHWCRGKNVPQNASLMQLADAAGLDIEALSAWVFEGVEIIDSIAEPVRGGHDRFHAILLLMPQVDDADDLRLIAERAGRLAGEREQAGSLNPVSDRQGHAR